MKPPIGFHPIVLGLAGWIFNVPFITFYSYHSVSYFLFTTIGKSSSGTWRRSLETNQAITIELSYCVLTQWPARSSLYLIVFVCLSFLSTVNHVGRCPLFLSDFFRIVCEIETLSFSAVVLSRFMLMDLLPIMQSPGKAKQRVILPSAIHHARECTA